MDLKTMALWGFAIYGGYCLIKTQTTYLNQAGGTLLPQGGRVAGMGCRGLTNRLRAKHHKLAWLTTQGLRPRQQRRLRYQIRQIEDWMREKGCTIPTM